MAERVIVIGGGLAGLAAAQALAERNYSVIVLESRQRLGGRAGSFTDPTTGQVIDVCQHVSMGCCTDLAHFFRTVGVAHLLAPHRELFFQTADGQVSRFLADRLPAPFHLARSFLRLHFLTFIDKLRVAWGLACLRLTRPRDDSPFNATPFLPWLKRHWQTPSTIDRFWSLVLVSALNESIDRIGLKYAQKVFVDGFLRDRRGYQVQVPTVPLDRLYGQELQGWYRRQKVEIRLNSPVRSIDIENKSAMAVTLRNGEQLSADWIVATVPHERLLDLLPLETVDSEPELSGLKFLSNSPITSVHLWFDRPVMKLPHVVLVDCLGQWLFSRGEVAPGEWYLQVVISAAHELRELGNDEIERRVLEELRTVVPESANAKRIRCRVVTEHAATFSPAPGVDYWRPGPLSPIDRLVLAGDWTATGWPATMEGAVRSGYAAANFIVGS